MSTTIDSNAPRQPQLKSVFNQEKKKNRAEEIEEKNKQRKSIEISILSKATIVCTTLSSSGHELFSKLTHGFDTVIIDEAAQVCANSYIALFGSNVSFSGRGTIHIDSLAIQLQKMYHGRRSQCKYYFRLDTLLLTYCLF